MPYASFYIVGILPPEILGKNKKGFKENSISNIALILMELVQIKFYEG